MHEKHSRSISPIVVVSNEVWIFQYHFAPEIEKVGFGERLLANQQEGVDDVAAMISIQIVKVCIEIGDSMKDRMSHCWIGSTGPSDQRKRQNQYLIDLGLLAKSPVKENRGQRAEWTTKRVAISWQIYRMDKISTCKIYRACFIALKGVFIIKARLVAIVHF